MKGVAITTVFVQISLAALVMSCKLASSGNEIGYRAVPDEVEKVGKGRESRSMDHSSQAQGTRYSDRHICASSCKAQLVSNLQDSVRRGVEPLQIGDPVMPNLQSLGGSATPLRYYITEGSAVEGYSIVMNGGHKIIVASNEANIVDYIQFGWDAIEAFSGLTSEDLSLRELESALVQEDISFAYYAAGIFPVLAADNGLCFFYYDSGIPRDQYFQPRDPYTMEELHELYNGRARVIHICLFGPSFTERVGLRRAGSRFMDTRYEEEQ